MGAKPSLRKPVAIVFTLFLTSLLISLTFSCSRVKGAGATGWYAQPSGTTNLLYDVSAVDAATVWAVGEKGTIIKTMDGGNSWETQTSGTTCELWGVDAADANTAWAVGGDGTILKTGDGGFTWTPQISGTTDFIYSVSAVDAHTVWALGTNATVLRTNDGGTTWKLKSPGPDKYLDDITAVDANTAWVVGDNGEISKTSDGGVNWTSQESGTNMSLNSISAVDSSTAWAVGHAGCILKTTDGGVTWAYKRHEVSYRDLREVSAVDPYTAWAVGDIPETYPSRIILKTSDGGSTWETQVNEIDYGLVGVDAVDANTAWAVGGEGTILHTRGGGSEFNFYFAEGYTGDGFQEFLSLGNPREATANATVTYLFNDGSTREQEVLVPPASRATVNVNHEVGPGKEVSVRVDCDLPIVAERPMYFTYGGRWSGGHTARGADSPNNYWYFAEGYTGPGFEEWVCVLNPGDDPANLTFDFQTQETGFIQRTGYSVPPHSRGSFLVNDVLGPNYQTSLKLSSDQPVVAERSTYFDYLGTSGHHWQGGHCVMGTNQAYNKFYFAEGTTRSGFEEWLTLQNPWNDSELTVEAIYLLGPGQGDPIQASYQVEPGSRLTVFVPGEVGGEKDVSVRLYSVSPFIAERPVYFSYAHGGISAQGGHCMAGVPVSAPEWFFAEGCTSDGFDQWLCLQNPGYQDSVVEVTYYTHEVGALPSRAITVPARTRVTIMVNEDAGHGYQLTSRLTVISGPNIIVERPMYFNWGGRNGGHDEMGFVPEI